MKNCQGTIWLPAMMLGTEDWRDGRKSRETTRMQKGKKVVSLAVGTALS